MPLSPEDATLLDYLHPKVLAEIGDLFRDGHYTECARNIAILVEEEVKELHKTEQLKVQKTATEMFWERLMQSAFSPPNNTITIWNPSTISWADIQKWYKEIFCGFITGIRNPLWHSTKTKISKEEVIYILFFASLLFYKVDNRLI